MTQTKWRSHKLRISHCRHIEAGDLQTIFHIKRQQGTQTGNAVCNSKVTNNEAVQIIASYRPSGSL